MGNVDQFDQDETRQPELVGSLPLESKPVQVRTPPNFPTRLSGTIPALIVHVNVHVDVDVDVDDPQSPPASQPASLARSPS
jgi:hypothetical protein